MSFLVMQRKWYNDCARTIPIRSWNSISYPSVARVVNRYSDMNFMWSMLHSVKGISKKYHFGESYISIQHAAWLPSYGTSFPLLVLFVIHILASISKSEKVVNASSVRIIESIRKMWVSLFFWYFLYGQSIFTNHDF